MLGLYGRWSLTWKMGLLGGSFHSFFFSHYLLFRLKFIICYVDYGLWCFFFFPLSEVFGVCTYLLHRSTIAFGYLYSFITISPYIFSA